MNWVPMTTQGRIIGGFVGAGMFVIAAGLGLGLHHSEAVPVPSPVAVEVAQLQRTDPGIDPYYADCVARALIFANAEGDKWDTRTPAQQSDIRQSVDGYCSRYNR
jgi:hypothetical protein